LAQVKNLKKIGQPPPTKIKKDHSWQNLIERNEFFTNILHFCLAIMKPFGLFYLCAKTKRGDLF
jgi:hypothetical protein